jgi:hypothetical protein
MYRCLALPLTSTFLDSFRSWLAERKEEALRQVNAEKDRVVHEKDRQVRLVPTSFSVSGGPFPMFA